MDLGLNNITRVIIAVNVELGSIRNRDSGNRIRYPAADGHSLGFTWPDVFQIDHVARSVPVVFCSIPWFFDLPWQIIRDLHIIDSGG